MIATRHITTPIQNIGEWWIRRQSRGGTAGFIRYLVPVRHPNEAVTGLHQSVSIAPTSASATVVPLTMASP